MKSTKMATSADKLREDIESAAGGLNAEIERVVTFLRETTPLRIECVFPGDVRGEQVPLRLVWHPMQAAKRSGVDQRLACEGRLNIEYVKQQDTFGNGDHYLMGGWVLPSAPLHLRVAVVPHLETILLKAREQRYEAKRVQTVTEQLRKAADAEILLSQEGTGA